MPLEINDLNLKPHFDSAVDKAADKIKGELSGVVFFIGTMWGVFLLHLVLSPFVSRNGWFDLNSWLDLNPGKLRGLIGIATMPFVHANWIHLISNTVPLLILLTLLTGSRAQGWPVVARIILLGGGLTWLVAGAWDWIGWGESSSHVGASGLVFGLITFLIAQGFFERKLISMAIAVVVGLLFAGSLIKGLLPIQFLPQQHISYSAHWCGAGAGILVALSQNKQASREVFSWGLRRLKLQGPPSAVSKKSSNSSTDRDGAA